MRLINVGYLPSKRRRENLPFLSCGITHECGVCHRQIAKRWDLCRRCVFGGISTLIPASRNGIDYFGMHSTPKAEFKEKPIRKEHKDHLVKGSYCWTCQLPTHKDVPGWKHESKNDTRNSEIPFSTFVDKNQGFIKEKYEEESWLDVTPEDSYFNTYRIRYKPEEEKTISYVMRQAVTWGDLTRDELGKCLHCVWGVCAYPVEDRNISPLRDGYPAKNGTANYWTWVETNGAIDQESGDRIEPIYANPSEVVYREDSTVFEETSAQEKLRNALPYLTDQQRKVWELKNDKTALRSDQEIGVILNISQQAVNNHYIAAFNKLKKLL